MIEDSILIASPSPRDIQCVKEAMDKLPCDKLYAKYMHEPVAYQEIRDFFLAPYTHKYEYLCIIPDDLVVPLPSFQYLLDDLEGRNWEVLSGLCNISYYQPEVYTPQLFTIDNPITYWITSKLDLEFVQQHWPQMLVKVKSAAFACCFIRRDVVEKIPFRGNQWNCGFDFAFEKDCDRLGIPIYVDVRAVCDHLARRPMSVNPYNSDPFENFFLNVKPKELRYVKWCREESVKT